MGETAEDAVKRELFEELGISAKIVRLDMTRDLCHPRRSQSATKVGMPVPPKSFF